MTTENQVKPTDVDKALLGTATYRSLGEQRLSPQEERFEKGRRTVGLFLAPLLTIVFLVLPIDIPREQQVLAAVLLGVIALWISEAVPIPIGGLLGVAVAVFLGVAPVDDVLGPFGSSTIFTFIGAFILAQAMLKHGVARRFAFRILSLPVVGKSTTGVILAFGLITCALSAFVSNTATVAMLLPTAIGILSVIAKLLQKRGDVEPDFDPAASARGRRDHADARLRRQRRRPAHPRRQPAQPDRARPHRRSHRRADQLLPVDDAGDPHLLADVRPAGIHPAAAEQAGDQAHRRRRGVCRGRAREVGLTDRAPRRTRSSRSASR